MKKLIVPVLCLAFLGCSQTLKINGETEPSLKEALKDKFLIGTALNSYQIWEKDTVGVGVIERQFNSIVAENCMKSMHIQLKEGVFNFKDADKFVEFGEKRNMFIVGHALIWHTQAADWFFTDDKGKDVSKEVLIKRMKDHITTIVSRYKGRVNGWDVVNEAFEDDGSWRKTKFYEIIGEDYLPLAFKFAHEADPEAELYYNDYNEWYVGRRDAIVKMVTQLKKEGIRIDAVGMQAHIGMTYPDIDEYKAAIDAYASTGVKVAITEFELSALPLPRQNIGANVADTTNYRKEMDPYTTGLPDSVAAIWTQRVSGFFDLFIDNSDKISRVTLWGVSDATSWKNNFPMPGRTDYPLLFDRSYKAKPVLEKIIKKAKETPKKNIYE